MIRSIEAKHGRAIGIVADLQGPKLRVGRFKNGSIELTKGMIIRLDLDKTEGDEKRVNLPHPEIIMSLDVGAMILCDDGKVRMKIVDKGADYLMAEVVAGVKLSNNKGVNVPGVILPITGADPERSDRYGSRPRHGYRLDRAELRTAR